IVKQPSFAARILGSAGYAVVLSPLCGAFLLPLAKSEGTERRAAHPNQSTPCGISVPGAVTSGRGREGSPSLIRAAFAALRPCRVQPLKAVPLIPTALKIDLCPLACGD